MKINPVNFNYSSMKNMNKILFKGRKEDAKIVSDSFKLADVQREYDIKKEYLNELHDAIGFSDSDYIKESRKLSAQRNHIINNFIGDFEEGEDDFIEKLTY
jgi:hypothetical protein